ncbi:hydrogenase expression protein HypB [Priestia megaterium]|uniref:Hydrogenase expression protein HypB n=2 Tax=Priestia megaterium TaxID=1404 RepID=A0A3D8X7T2_PRIMG|nr:aminoglycoside phosphotransferase family protein [Priestia megaterium]MDH3170498.1 aminoglycoside phosphotransferase family protein [Priestia megaterium]RDZ17850.1 hydrogenase expression protein HypB [Priestia megaterium]
MYTLPQTFCDTVTHLHSHKGQKWLADFPQLIRYCQQRWHINIQSHFPLSYHFVAPARKTDGSELVVKLFVEPSELLHEQEALTALAGENTVKIVDSDAEKGILMLEKLSPGCSLSSLLTKDEAALIAARLMKSLRRVPHSDSTIETAVKRERQLRTCVETYPNGIGLLSSETLQSALSTFSELNRSCQQLFLLHGDLHHDNILQSGEDTWKIIDPKGLIGEKEYEIIPFLLNHLPKTNVAKVIDYRINIFVEELNLSKKRILLWGYAHSVLATCWLIEDCQDAASFLHAIEAFQHLYERYYGHKK